MVSIEHSPTVCQKKNYHFNQNSYSKIIFWLLNCQKMESDMKVPDSRISILRNYVLASSISYGTYDESKWSCANCRDDIKRCSKSRKICPYPHLSRLAICICLCTLFPAPVSVFIQLHTLKMTAAVALKRHGFELSRDVY